MEVTRARQHIEFKQMMREIDDQVATRMLMAIEGRSDQEIVDYQQLLRDATFIVPPALVFHTAPVDQRDAIRARGLLPSAPNVANWTSQATFDPAVAQQPVGVYVGAKADTRGIWSHWATWDVWQIDTTDLPWVHDTLNPGSWVITTTVNPDRLTYQGTYPTDR